MGWSAVGQLAGVELLWPCRQFACSTRCDVVAVQEEFQADVTDIDAIGLMSRFAEDSDVMTQGLVLVSVFPVDSCADSPKGAP